MNDQRRIDEIEGALRLHRFHGVNCPRLPADTRSPEYTDIARAAVERERAELARLGIKRLAASEGPQPVLPPGAKVSHAPKPVARSAPPLVLLGFGSSARRGATGWTDRAKVRAVIDACYPDATIDGASPAGGADLLFHEEARAHFDARGLPFAARRCPVDASLDGPWPAAGHRRNARMYREHRPSLAAGFVSGRVGSPLSSGSAGMADICRIHGCPVVVFRDDGIEPLLLAARADLVDYMLRLHKVTKDERLVPPGRGVRALMSSETSREAVIASLACAAEGSRWAPWIEAVAATVRANL